MQAARNYVLEIIGRFWWSQGGSRTPDLLNAIFNAHMPLVFLAIPEHVKKA
jgi:hypothetical protein